MAFYKYFWDLANSTEYTDHTVGAFDNNTESGGGDFKWVLNANNTLVNNIPGIRIKPTSTTNGYWVRVTEGPVSVNWFGPQNTVSAPYTFVQLGVSQNTLNNRYGPGVVNTTDTYDTAAIKAAMNYMSIVDGENCLMFEPKQYWVTQSIQLPADNPSLTSLPTIGGQGKFIIDGNGCTVTTYGPAVPFDVFVRVPANQTVADNTYIKYGFVFKNFGATSWGASYIGSGNSFLYLAASNDVVVDNLNLVNYDIGVRLEYCPNTSVTNVNTSNVSAYSVYIKEGTWLGATLTNACSNNVYVRNLHVKDTNGQTAGLAMAGCNNAVISQFHLDGVGTPSYGIHWDSLDNGQAMTVRILDSYFTNGTSSGAIYIKAQDGGLVNIDGIYNEAVQTVVSTEMYSGTAYVYVSNSAVWPAGSKLSNIGTPEWEFKAVNFGPGITTVADIINPANNLWVTTGGAVIPSSGNVNNMPAGAPPCFCTLQNVIDNDHDLVNGNAKIGTNAGEAMVGAPTNVVAIGTDAAYLNGGNHVYALGNSAAYNNTGDNVVAIGYGSAKDNTGDNCYGLGDDSINDNDGDNVIGIGEHAAYLNTGDYTIAIGQDSANNNTGANTTAIGFEAARDNTGVNIVAIGQQSCHTNTGFGVTAVGHNSGFQNTGNDVAGIGFGAASQNTGSIVTALGSSSAFSNTGQRVVALGSYAAQNNTGDFVVGINEGAASQNTGTHVFAAGYGAALQNIGNNVIGIGFDAANQNTGSNVIALGNNAADGNTAQYVIALGNSAGVGNTVGNTTVIANDYLQSFVNFAAATVVYNPLSVPPGTYLYHDQATNSIGAVRVP